MWVGKVRKSSNKAHITYTGYIQFNKVGSERPKKSEKSKLVVISFRLRFSNPQSPHGSQKYVLGELAGMSRLLTAADERRRERLLAQMKTNFDTARAGIADIIRKTQERCVFRELSRLSLGLE